MIRVMSGSNKKGSANTPSLGSIPSLSKQFEEIYGPDTFSVLQSSLSRLSGNGEIWKSVEQTRDVLKTQSEAMKEGITRFLTSPSKWAIDSVNSLTSSLSSIAKSITEPNISVLAKLEAQTGLLANDQGISTMTSVASQLSKVSEVLSSQSRQIKELIAPSTMMSDLQSIATLVHQSIIDAGSISSWKLGVIDSASLLTDRQINWASRVYSTIYDERGSFKIEDLSDTAPRVNVISVLSEELEIEKKERDDVSPSEALKNSDSLRLSEKGKMLIDKIISINRLCERTGREPLFKYTGGTMAAAASMGGTICSTREALGDIVDGLYMLFYENLERIKKVVSDETVRKHGVFNCVFHVKNMRTDFRHDFEHGSESDIKKKNNDIGKSYAHYAEKPVLLSRKDYLRVQEKLYDEFGELVEYLFNRL